VKGRVPIHEKQALVRKPLHIGCRDHALIPRVAIGRLTDLELEDPTTTTTTKKRKKKKKVREKGTDTRVGLPGSCPCRPLKEQQQHRVSVCGRPAQGWTNRRGPQSWAWRSPPEQQETAPQSTHSLSSSDEKDRWTWTKVVCFCFHFTFFLFWLRVSVPASRRVTVHHRLSAPTARICVAPMGDSALVKVRSVVRSVLRSVVLTTPCTDILPVGPPSSPAGSRE
jgi:hypothetical protein